MNAASRHPIASAGHLPAVAIRAGRFPAGRHGRDVHSHPCLTPPTRPFMVEASHNVTTLPTLARRRYIHAMPGSFYRRLPGVVAIGGTFRRRLLTGRAKA